MAHHICFCPLPKQFIPRATPISWLLSPFLRNVSIRYGQFHRQGHPWQPMSADITMPCFSEDRQRLSRCCPRRPSTLGRPLQDHHLNCCFAHQPETYKPICVWDIPFPISTTSLIADKPIAMHPSPPFVLLFYRSDYSPSQSLTVCSAWACDSSLWDYWDGLLWFFPVRIVIRRYFQVSAFEDQWPFVAFSMVVLMTGRRILRWGWHWYPEFLRSIIRRNSTLLIEAHIKLCEGAASEKWCRCTWWGRIFVWSGLLANWIPVKTGDFQSQTPCHVQSQETNCVSISVNALQNQREGAG
jgi:hypothetical protein